MHVSTPRSKSTIWSESLNLRNNKSCHQANGRIKMTRILLCGCGGKMGRTITELVESRDDCEIVAGIDVRGGDGLPYPVFEKPCECGIEADVIIDFSLPDALDDLLAYAQEKKLALVECTTGYSDDELARLDAASETIPLFRSGNMSLGINLLMELTKKAAQILGTSFDIEIVEKHHNLKVDAPSGTALMLADSACEGLGEKYMYEYDRHSRRIRRPKKEIGIHAVRGGTIVGEHEVIFAGANEVITLSHSAQSKGVFAAGAVNAAVFLAGKAPGKYSMSDLIG